MQDQQDGQENLLHFHLTEMILAVTDVQVGLLVNFGKKRLEYKRVHHPTYHAFNLADLVPF